MKELTMSKKKGKEVLKVIAVTALSIGIMSATFIGINSMAFAASANAVTSMSPVMASAAVTNTATNVSATQTTTPETTAQSESFQEPNITVVLPSAAFTRTPGANAMSHEEAAMLGAQYIWDMFGICIDGKTVTMNYQAFPSNIRTYWNGSIGRAFVETPMECGDVFHSIVDDKEVITFTLDSITGERIDIDRFNFGTPPPTTEWGMRIATEEELRAPTPLDGYIQIAKEHAARHFIHADVVSAEFTRIGRPGTRFDENGYLIAISRGLVFDVTDSTGRVAEVTFCETTHELLGIMTIHNDIMPGWVYGSNRQSPDANEREGRSSQQSPEEIEAIMRERGLLQ